MKLLLVEDDVVMRTALERALGRRGFQIEACGDGTQALEKWRARTFDVVMLDDRIMGLNLGADDYLPKPFDLDELEARLRALARRSTLAAFEREQAGNFGDMVMGALRYDKSSGAFYHAGQAMELTPRELALLQALMVKPGHAVAKEKLFELVFPGQTDVQFEAVEVVVYRLRKKLLHCGVTLMTLRGLGYLIKAST